jgi:transcriptional regulator with XRE-family HTH domain
MTTLTTPAEKLIAFIVARRAELGLTQREVAAAAGMEPGTLANLEVGRVTRSPRADTLSKLARGLRVSPDVLSRLASGDDAPAPIPRLPFDAAVSPIGDTKTPPADLAGGVFDPARPAWHDLDRHAIRRPSGDARG